MTVASREVAPPANSEVLGVDRRSIFGNPFVLANADDAEQRAAVCDAHRECLRRALQSEPVDTRAVGARHGVTGEVRTCDWAAVAAAVRQLQAAMRRPGAVDLALMCHCAPRRCHADSLREALEGKLP